MIVITTPTGQIGRQILDTLLDSTNERAKAIRVIARDPDRLSPRARERVEVVRGSHSDIGIVTKALACADSVLWLVPPDPRAASLHRHVLTFTEPICEAISGHPATRVVAVSSLGRGATGNAGQISAIRAMDNLIESTGVRYRSLCPPGFMDNLLWQVESIKHQGLFFSPLPGDRRIPACATGDIAAVAARLLLDDSWSGQDSVPLPGPEDLSFLDMAQVMTEVLGRPIRFQQVRGEAYQAAFVGQGMSQAWARGLVDMAAAVEQGIYDGVPRSARSATPTNFRQWCVDFLKPAVLA